jgi:multidrug transporter EmrE-like cation transporter
MWLALAGAIGVEVCATLSLRASDGLRKRAWIAPVILGYLISFVLLWLTLRLGMPVGIAYGVWSACGVALVAVDEADSPLAFIDLEADGHIDLLYCAPEFAGSGLADGLYEAVEAAARAGGIARLYSEASEAALRFFRKRGFVMLHRRDLKIGDVAIHNYAVEKPLK